MSEMEKRLIAKMKANAEKLDRIKNGDKSVEDRLVKQVISLVLSVNILIQKYII